MQYTWLGIAAAVLLLVFGIVGYRRGFIKEAISVCFALLSIFIVWFINPYVNTALTEHTPVYEYIQEQTENYLGDKLQKMGVTGEGAEEKIREALPIPDMLKDQVMESMIQKEGIQTNLEKGVQSVSGYLAELLVNGLSFLISLLIVNIVLRILAQILNLLSRLPIINGVNRFAGLFLGLAKGILVIWIVLLLLTVICQTEIGKACMQMVNEDKFLQALYNANPLMKIFM